jgi:hypothetical protein
MNLKQYIKDNASILDINFTTAAYDAKVSWYEFLKQASSIDLSLGHCLQHNQTAKNSVQLSNCVAANEYINAHSCYDLIGTSSVLKHHDSCEIVNSQIQGEKHYISNLGFCDYHVLWTNNKDLNLTQVVFLLDNAPGVTKDLTFAPLGMESTSTGKLLFNNADQYQVLYPLSSPLNATRSYYHNFSFCTVSLGLCSSLLEEIKKITAEKNINHGMSIMSYQQQLDLYNDLWYQLLPTLMMSPCQENSHKVHKIYSQCKLLIAELIKVFLLIGDSRHTQWGADSQLFRNALTYVTHRQNFSTSLVNYF